MSAATADEKATKRAERLRKRRDRLRTEMRKDVQTLRKIIYGVAKPA